MSEDLVMEFRVVKIEYASRNAEDAVRMTLGNIDNLAKMEVFLTHQEYNEYKYLRIGHLVSITLAEHEAETRTREQAT
jgi:hypothetical protein